jgi:hypothetical protein
MKTGILTLCFSIAATGIFAQTGSYENAMKQGFADLDSARSNEQLIQVAGKFDQISKVATQEWLPAYYASYIYLIASFGEQDGTKKDQILDQSEQFIAESIKRKGDESENLVLQAFICLARIQVDPMGRGMEYSMKSNAFLEKAKNVNAENPRIYYLQGTTILNTPAQYGGGRDEAMPTLLMAKEKYEKFKLPAPFWPDWGKDYLDRMLDQK